MNEQLVVKNFGPIKDATVDFKRVTVFIGPTGGGKSTLAKLITILRNKHFLSTQKSLRLPFLRNYSIDKYIQEKTFIGIANGGFSLAFNKNLDFGGVNLAKNEVGEILRKGLDGSTLDADDIVLATETLSSIASKMPESFSQKIIFDALCELSKKSKKTHDKLAKILVELGRNNIYFEPKYLPAERTFVAAIEYSWAGLMRDDIGLPKTVLEFANTFSIARQEIDELEIPFIKATYRHIDGLDYIKHDDSDELFRINETASGIQSVTPLLVLLEHLSRNTEQAQSFIIEEPELNLYPTAQQGLLNWLVEKCTKGENDLTITTHSPYILSHLNLMLYAYQVAEKHPDQKAAIAAIVPEASWINPKEFACYQVEGGGVHSLVDAELGLIDNNALDNISGDKADAFDQLININRGFAHA